MSYAVFGHVFQIFHLHRRRVSGIFRHCIIACKHKGRILHNVVPVAEPYSDARHKVSGIGAPPADIFQRDGPAVASGCGGRKAARCKQFPKRTHERGFRFLSMSCRYAAQTVQMARLRFVSCGSIRLIFKDIPFATFFRGYAYGICNRHYFGICRLYMVVLL